eukprot:scaffold1192_cov58-Cylindrotheca_fusiformis.AAC.6
MRERDAASQLAVFVSSTIRSRCGTFSDRVESPRMPNGKSVHMEMTLADYFWKREVAWYVGGAFLVKWVIGSKYVRQAP